METVLYICLTVFFLWGFYPTKRTTTDTEEPSIPELVETPITKLVYIPKLVETPITELVYQEQLEPQSINPKPTVLQMRKLVRDKGIKGSARMNKAQCLAALGWN